MTEQTAKRSYKDTLNLPKTAFAMKANLVQNEPASLKRWQQMKLYEKVREARRGSPRYVFHDGPPYANGSIHLGHLLNKCLKDFVVRSRTMMGLDVPYVPGWDCHGLPIEHKVMAESRESGADLSDTMKVRRKCKAYAEKFVKLQSQQMQRLLTLADYGEPYLTMDPKFEASTLEVFASLVEAGLVYRGLKPVHWSIENQTALADAELEYYDREDTSVYVRFDVDIVGPVETSSGLMQLLGASLLIWTTTPWTLPANLAVAVHPNYEYGLYKVSNGKPVIVAIDLASKVFALAGIKDASLVKSIKGSQLVDNLTYQHPFIEDSRSRGIVAAEYVTLEDGTGLVHTAPGHGVEDYQTGLREKLDIYCPVRGDGTFDDTAPDWLRGRSVWDANKLVCDRLTQSGHMFHQHQFNHSYPHDWRGKTPVIFRATEQWFVAVDHAFRPSAPGSAGGATSLRDRAMASTADITFIPDWGRNRMRGMLESRPDWCISRQRAWGLPIPAFYGPGKDQVLLTAASIRAVAAVLREKGSDAWFLMTPEELLAKYDLKGDRDAPAWTGHLSALSALTKSHDIFDVWFESGSSWNACMRQRGLSLPDDAPAHTDLYLEGSDQHRGWFQLSLLPSLGATGKPPFRSVLTHGFMVDKDGRKMSKSLGNALEVDELLKNYGADVCRWWVASLNTDNDIKVDESFFKLAGEEYRKVRNTIRFLLSNLYDYTPQAEAEVAFEPTSLDAWVLSEFNGLVRTLRDAYESLRFPGASEAIFNFCNETLSAVYLAAVKDRLYCDAPGSARRRRAQAAMHTIASGLIRMLAPILPHTADEAWAALTGGSGAQCVHLLPLPEPRDVIVDVAWRDAMVRRNGWLKAIEDFRQTQGIDNPLDVGLVAEAPDVLDLSDLADLCMISRFDRGSGVKVIDLRDQPRCERSWKRDGTVRQRSDGGMLCDRCAAAIGVR